jgi:hypothetical protein
MARRGFGDGRLPTQGVDDRHQSAQVRQQVAAGAAGQEQQGFVPEAVKGLCYNSLNRYAPQPRSTASLAADTAGFSFILA